MYSVVWNANLPTPSWALVEIVENVSVGALVDMPTMLLRIKTSDACKAFVTYCWDPKIVDPGAHLLLQYQEPQITGVVHQRTAWSL